MKQRGTKKTGGDTGSSKALPPPTQSSSHSRQNNKHIRFDDHEDGVVGQEMTSEADNDCDGVGKQHISDDSSQKRKRKKRKRTADITTGSSNNSGAASSNKIFNGIILAISTDNKHHNNTPVKSSSNHHHHDDDNNDQYDNLKSLKAILTSIGATISPQVHKKVHYIICTSSAIHNLTQRIRQAIKRNVDIVSVQWVKDCIKDNRRIDVTPYICNEMAREILVEKELDQKKKSLKKKKNDNDESGSYHCDDDNDDDDNDIIPEHDNRGWSTPVQLDCCCVCHENGDDNCPWCSECNINLEKKRRKKLE